MTAEERLAEQREIARRRTRDDMARHAGEAKIAELFARLG